MARYQPALLGGLFIGVLSALPILGGLNLCCCLWVVAGGVLTTYLMQQQADPLPLETSAAALGGLIAGVIGGVIMIAAQQLFMLLTGGAAAQREAMEQVMSQVGDVPPQLLEMIEWFSTGPAALLITAAVTIPIFAVVGLLGALLGLAFFRKKAGPAAA